MPTPPRATAARPNPLDDLPADLRESYDQAARLVAERFSPATRRVWAGIGLELARGGSVRRSATLSYFQATPPLADGLSGRRFLAWARQGQRCTENSERTGAAFFQASPAALGALGPQRFATWMTMGHKLVRPSLAGDALAQRFFEVTPRLVQYGTFSDILLLDELLHLLDRQPLEMCIELLNYAVRLFVDVQGADRTAYLRVCRRIAHQHAQALRPFVATASALYTPLDEHDRGRFLHAMERLTQATEYALNSLFPEMARGLGPLVATHGAAPFAMLARIAERSSAAAREFLRNAATVAQRLTPAQMDAWCRAGEAILAARETSGIGYFQLQSHEAMESIAAMTPAIELFEVREVLRLYCQALMGKPVAVVSSERLADRSAHRSLADEIDWQGAVIFCPSRMELFPAKDANFDAYKVLATHQAARLEFGTIDFRFTGDGRLLGSLRAIIGDPLARSRGSYTEFEQFFDLCADRQLIRDLFMMAEDTRVDRRVLREYRGIRSAFRRVQQNAVERRPDPRALPLRQLAVELLVRHSLEADPLTEAPTTLAEPLRAAAGLLNLMADGSATVEYAAEAALRLYQLLDGLPDTAVDDAVTWMPLDLGSARYDAATEDLAQLAADFLRLNEEQRHAAADSVAAAPVAFRGDVAPELQQVLQKLRRTTQQMARWQQGDDQAVDLDLLSDAELLDLVEDYLGTSELFDAAAPVIEGEAGVSRFRSREEVVRFLRGHREGPSSAYVRGPQVGEEEEVVTSYDEWDYRTRAYRPNWCQVHQRRLKEGGSEFYEQTLGRYRWLVHKVRLQFEMLRPENYGRVKRLLDGEEIDLDAVVDAFVQRRAGQSSSEKLYSRNHKVDRSVAVALLVDLSVSTGEAIEAQEPRPVAADEPNVAAAAVRSEPKRVIDLERESMVVFIEALEQIGDAYGIYGFSSSGRDAVQFYTIKDMQEVFSDRVRRRVDTMTALHGTRMGPAIRHAVAKLEAAEAKTKVLILLSDGRPQDRDYGLLPWSPELLPRAMQGFNDYGFGSAAHRALMLDEKEYAIHDTKQALSEARTKGIKPFCISVDKQGRDYLRAMCGDIGYEVISEIQSLPRRLPALYRKLTT
ncbi:MAG: VWA domain-containing protein [Chloroflexi bacterium]|nr:VWA domain-containing protein [Chloroflexota bacterium]